MLKSKFKKAAFSPYTVPWSGSSVATMLKALYSKFWLCSPKQINIFLEVLMPDNRCGGAANVAMPLIPTLDFKLDWLGVSCEVKPILVPAALNINTPLSGRAIPPNSFLGPVRATYKVLSNKVAKPVNCTATSSGPLNEVLFLLSSQI